MEHRLEAEEKQILLKLARQALEEGVTRKGLSPIRLDELPERLRQRGASFVTLTERGMLRGCIGALEAHQPLAEDVRQHAVDAALHDYRFPPVQPSELEHLQIEISVLTPARTLAYQSPEELPRLLRPHIDGVTLRDGMRRATFLPQVWEKLPDAETFLGHLCEKMGAAPDLWRRRKLDVQIYQVDEFHE